MKICLFDKAGEARVGLVQGDSVLDVTSRVPAGTGTPVLWVAAQPAAQVALWAESAPRRAVADTAFLSPIQRPAKVVAAPVNYKAHVQEMHASGQAHGHLQTDIREAGMFLKAPSAVVGASQGIAQRFLSRRTDHEIELCAIIGRDVDQAAASDALACVAGYCLGLDITVRGPEDRSFRKSMDTYCVLGPWMVTPDELGDPQDVMLRLSVNGELRQHTNTSDMVQPVAELIEYTTSFYSLQPGDVLMTGTPQGVGPIRPGDTIVARADRGLGEMSVKVRAAAGH